MSTVTLDPQTSVEPYEDDSASYRALHAGAIVGVLLAVCSLIYPLTVASLTDMQYLLLLAAIPLAAMAISWMALRSIRANSEIYTGAKLATVGLAVAAASLIGGSAYGGLVFATEVPDGYQRVSFQGLKPSAEDEEALRPIPEHIQQLMGDGERVFIKGYIRPDSVQYKTGNKEFLLVRDNNQCCFGDVNKVAYFDQMMVYLGDGLSADLETRLFRLGGTLTCRAGNTAQGEPVLVYSLQADYIK